MVAMAACNHPKIEGSWLEPVPGMPGMEQGFILEGGGKASSINMATLQYNTWKKEGDKLILSGQSLGNRQTIPFSDTLIIEELTTDRLIVKQRDLSRAFVRSSEELMKDTIAASALTPAKKVLTVKGRLILGHEVRSFMAEGDTVSHWIVDKTDSLTEKYDELTKGVKNGTPVYVEIEVVDMGKSEEGFAADYASVYEVVKINKIERLSGVN